ncbi:GumC family protein [Roseivirga sp. BDSF3-8]|uniref:GumC family protein n=1 Tax=Roseivirga sp. BDSF3-8 TaxID=3241598 RepID=UPI003531AF0A
MEENKYDIGVRSVANEDSESLIEKIDFGKLLLVIRKSLPWIILIVTITTLSAYLTVRYTKPLYESSSDLKLNIKSEASILGLNNLDEVEENKITNISGEIELIRSRLFFKKIIDELNLETTYHAYGNFLNDERYKNSPFTVVYELTDRSYYDKPFDVELLRPNTFRFSYTHNGQKYSSIHSFGEEITGEGFSIKIYGTEHYSPSLPDREYYFVINSEPSLINYLDNGLEVVPYNIKANTIRISFRDHNPFKAKDLVNAIDTLYLLYTREEKNKANKQKIDFLNEQLSLTEEKLGQYEDYFENFTIEYKTTDLKGDIGRVIGMMEQLDSMRFSYQKRLRFINQVYDEISVDDAAVNELLADNDYLPQDLTTLVQEFSELVQEKELLLTSYNPNTFTVKKKNQELELLKSSILDRLNSIRENIFTRLGEVNNRRLEMEDDFTTLPGKSMEYTKIKRKYDLDEERYLMLMEKKAEFQIAEAGTTTDFVILSSASVAPSPIYPQKGLVMGAGLVAGFIFSLLFVGGRYALHNKISSQSELEAVTSIPVLGTVPVYHLDNISETRMIVDKHPKSGVSEALRAIRTNLEFLTAKKKTKVISVTSTISGEGKTFVASNLGGIIAMSGSKVLIMDLDMRRPKVHKAFEKTNGSKGVSTLLIGRSTLEECIQRTSLENLDIISAGPNPPNPSELIMSTEMEEVLEHAKQLYDVVILDTPPVGLVTDGMLAMKKADLPLYIVRAEYSKKAFLKSVNRLVKVNRLNKLCLILNATSSYAEYGYGYGYGYGMGYYEEPDQVEKKSFFKKIFSRN